jgi:hypothetical protein
MATKARKGRKPKSPVISNAFVRVTIVADFPISTQDDYDMIQQHVKENDPTTLLSDNYFTESKSSSVIVQKSTAFTEKTEAA